MEKPLEHRLSEIIGDRKNRNIRFSFDAPPDSGPEVPLLEILLNDERLVRIRLGKVGKSKYGITVGDERVVVYQRSALIRVVDSSGKTLVEQKYTPVYSQ